MEPVQFKNLMTKQFHGYDISKVASDLVKYVTDPSRDNLWLLDYNIEYFPSVRTSNSPPRPHRDTWVEITIFYTDKKPKGS